MKRFTLFILIGIMSFCLSGCALIGTALTAAAAYGIYEATKK